MVKIVCFLYSAYFLCRKAAQKWHPDNFPEGDEKKKAEKKFIDVAAAKEVLTDPGILLVHKFIN